MKQWNNKRHEEALRRRKQKNEERSYIYEEEYDTSTGVIIQSGTMADIRYSNPPSVRRRRK